MITRTKITFLVPLVLITLIITNLKAEEKIEAVIDQIQIISKDLKTLEKAVYSGSENIKTRNISSNNLNEDVLTKHLLKLNDIEDQFRDLTNKFEEINFKIDKLSKRVTKIQSDNQLRFSDLESGDFNDKQKKISKKAMLPGTSKPQDFGANPGYNSTNLPSTQNTNSIESAAAVITSEPEKKSLFFQKNLPRSNMSLQ